MIISLFLLQVLVGFFLLAVALIDIKLRSVPAVITTGGIFVMAILFSNNITFGVLTFILSWLLIEAEFFSGLADLKIAVFLGLLISNSTAFILFTFLILIYGVFYKIIVKKYFKKETQDEIAFIPVFVVVYLTLVIVHYFSLVNVFSL